MALKISHCTIAFVFGILLCAHTGFSQSHELADIKSFAQRGNDTTLILLDRIEPEIDFVKDTDLAFEFFLTKFEYYYHRQQKQAYKEVLDACKLYNDQSDNEYLKLSYQIACIHQDNVDLDSLEPQLREYREQASEQGFNDLLVEINIYIMRMFRRRSEYDSLNIYLDESKHIVEENNFRLKEGKLFRFQGVREVNDIDAFKFFDRAIEVYNQEGYEIGVARVLSNKAKRYQTEKSYEDALSIYQKTLDIFKQNKLNYNVAFITQNIGRIYQEFGNDEVAIKHFDLAKEAVVDSLYPYIVARINTDLGRSYIELGNLREGKNYLTKSIASKEKLKDNYTLARSYTFLGELYLQEGKLDLAKEQFENAITNSEKVNLRNELDEANAGLLHIAIEKNDIQSAERYAKLAMEYADENEAPESKYSTLLSLAKLSGLKGDYKKANQYYESSVNMQNSVFDSNEKSRITNLIEENENQRKENEKQKLEYENQRKTAIIDKNKFRIRLYLISLVSVLFILFTLLRSFLQNKKATEAQKKLNASLNESNRKLAESNSQLEQFAHVASHDMKSPLRTITSFSTLLEKKANTNLGEEEKKFLSFIVKSGKDLTAMIDDMLAYSKVGSQKVMFMLTDMDVMINNTISSLRGIAQDNAIELKQLRPLPNAMADEVKIKRVFQNIISNALKFYDPNKTNRYVHIDYKQIGKFHQFSICDNGIGIPDTDKNLFEPFTYLNSKDDYKGTGIGLAMCRKIVDKHGGKIWYESEVGKGTCFYFTIMSQPEKVQKKTSRENESSTRY